MNLVPEHVDELQTGRLEDRQLVDVLFLKLGNHKLVQILMQLRLLNSELDDTQPGAVVLHHDCDQQVQQARFVLPVGVAARIVLLEQLCDVVPNQFANLGAELTAQSLDELEAVPPPRLQIRLLEVVAHVAIWIILELINLFFSDGNVWHHNDLEDFHQVCRDELLAVRRSGTTRNVVHDALNELCAFLASWEPIAFDKRPNRLESLVSILFKILTELVSVHVEYRGNLRLCLNELVRLSGRVLLADDECADLHNGWQLLLVEIRQFLLTKDGLNDVKRRIDEREGSLYALLVHSLIRDRLRRLDEASQEMLREVLYHVDHFAEKIVTAH